MLTASPVQATAESLPSGASKPHAAPRGTGYSWRQPFLRRARDDIDRLFQSAAASYGCRLIAVILTGRLTDGTAGLQSVKQLGGTTIIQDPEEAEFPSMPQSAQDRCAIDYCLPLAHIAQLLPRLLADMASH